MLKVHVLAYIDVVVFRSHAQQTVTRAISHIKGLSNLSAYEVIMEIELGWHYASRTF